MVFWTWVASLEYIEAIEFTLCMSTHIPTPGKVRTEGITSICCAPFLERTFAFKLWNPFSNCYVISCFQSWPNEGKSFHHQPQTSELMSTHHICEFFLLKIWNYSKEGLRSKKGHLLISLREGKLSFLNAILWHQINVNRGKQLQSWHYFLFVQTPKSISDIISWRYSETNGNICCIYLYRKCQNIL